MEIIRKIKFSLEEMQDTISRYFQIKNKIKISHVFRQFLTDEELKKYLGNPDFQKVLLYLGKTCHGLFLLVEDPVLTPFYNPEFPRFSENEKKERMLFIPRGGFMVSPTILENKDIFYLFRSKISEVFKGKRIVIDYSPEIGELSRIFYNFQKIFLDEMVGWAFKREECEITFPIIEEVSVLDTFTPPLEIFEESWSVLREGFKESRHSPCPHYFNKEEYAEIFKDSTFKKTFLFYKKKCIGGSIVANAEKVPFLNIVYFKSLPARFSPFCIWDLTIVPNHRRVENVVLLLRSTIESLPRESLIFFDHSQILNPSLPRAVKIALRLTNKPFGLQKLGTQRYEVTLF